MPRRNPLTLGRGGCQANEKAFKQIFPDQGSVHAQDYYLPQRGLREIRRFGHVPLLRALQQRVISLEEVQACLKAESVPSGSQLSSVAENQQQREQLHAEWVKQRATFTKAKAYAEALQQVVGHRHLANRVRLVDHVNAHRLVPAILILTKPTEQYHQRDAVAATRSA